MMPTITKECSQFLQESNGQSLIKALPTTYQGFAKVKVRVSKRKTEFTENFNRAFETTRHDLHQRSIFAYTTTKMIDGSAGTEPFYVFPTNGYQILLNPAVRNSQVDYGDYDDLHIDGRLVSDQLRMSYRIGTIQEAARADCEIIIYGIRYYYAVRASLIDDYAAFFDSRN